MEQYQKLTIFWYQQQKWNNFGLTEKWTFSMRAAENSLIVRFSATTIQKIIQCAPTKTQLFDFQITKWKCRNAFASVNFWCRMEQIFTFFIRVSGPLGSEHNLLILNKGIRDKGCCDTSFRKSYQVLPDPKFSSKTKYVSGRVPTQLRN